MIISTTQIFVIAILFCVLVALVNIITNVIKKLIKPAQIVAFVTSILLSELACFGYALYYTTIDTLFMGVCVGIVGIIVGFITCYTAMYGYDNLYQQIKEVFTRVKEIKDIADKEK